MQFLLMIHTKTILSVLLEKKSSYITGRWGFRNFKSHNFFAVDLGFWNHAASAIMLDSDSVDRAIELCTSIVIELLKLHVGVNTFCALVHCPWHIQFTFICGRQRTLALYK